MGTQFDIAYLERDPSKARFLADINKHISYWSVFWRSLSAVVGVFLLLAWFYSK